MLKKIIKIKNVGKFQDYHPMGDLEFQKMTLIYAENARGKTTFTDILRSLQCGDPNYVVGRQTLGVTENPEIVLRFDSSNTTFTGRSWSEMRPDIAIFDSTFVHQNVFAGDSIDHSHKKNLYSIIVGQEGVKLAQRVDELNGQIREMNREINKKQATVKQFVPTGMTVDLDKFLALPKHEDIDKEILDAEAEVTAMEQAGDILNRKPLEKIVLPVLPSNFSNLLGKTIDNVSNDAERLVRDHMSLHTNGATQPWLAEGVGYLKDETCPFCAQSVQSNDLLSAYRTYFGLTYAKLKEEISNLQTQVNTVLGETALLTLQEVIAENQSASTFWQGFVPLKAPTISFRDQVQVPLGKLRACCQSRIKEKMEALLEPITLGADLTAALADYESTNRIIQSYNSAVEVANKLIVERKSKAEAGDLQNAKQHLQLLKAIKQRHKPDAIQACSDYQSDVGTKNSLEDQKNNAKAQLDQYTEHVFPRYQGRVNQLLGKFNTSFRITGTTRSYTGGTPSSSYDLVINEVSVNLGNPNTPPDAASFRNTLSAGDRSTLALAFFIAQLEDDAHLSRKIVVLDDPITSQDRFRRTCTQQLLRKLYLSCKQVVILSHDARFLKLVWDSTMRCETKTLQFFPMGQNTVVREWDIQDATLDDYSRDYELVTHYLNCGKGDPRRVAQALRPLLEGYFRVKFSKQFHKENRWLGDFIGKIMNADSSSPLYSVHNAVAEIEAVNDYSKKYHHATNPGADAEPIDNGELQGYVRRALEIIHGT